MAKQKPKVKMVGEDGNAFFILGRCRRAMREFGREQEWSLEEIDAKVEEFTAEATADDYDHLLRTVMKYFDIDSGGDDDDYGGWDEDWEDEDEEFEE